MNRQAKADAEFCGRVPLHQTNLLQPHGYLLVVSKEQFTILQAGENIEALFGKPVKHLLNTPLTQYIEKEELEQISHPFSKSFSQRLPFTLTINGQPYVANIKQQQSYYIFEIEQPALNGNHTGSFTAVYQKVKYVMAALESATSVPEICSLAVRELKNISGFDKVMVYSFDEEWNGNVIAEAMETGMDRYLGLTFPASDIPKQARALYKKTPFRLIPDIHYQPVKLYPVINPVTNAFTDLSDSNLRSVAAVHLEYLSNMGVQASMSTRILKNNQLWGLIACHHRTPKYLSFEMCVVFELLADLISVKLQAIQSSEDYETSTYYHQLFSEVVKEVYDNGGIVQSFPFIAPQLLTLLDAGGVALVIDGEVKTAGTVPPEIDINQLTMWLQAQNSNELYQQPALSSVYEAAADFTEEASGLLAIPVQPEKGNYVLAFRPEAVTTVNWGGNPGEAIQFEADNIKYHPRASFQIWQQVVKQKSLPWKPAQLAVAARLKNFFESYSLNKGDR